LFAWLGREEIIRGLAARLQSQICGTKKPAPFFAVPVFVVGWFPDF
jgi:hypothetical protein